MEIQQLKAQLAEALKVRHRVHFMGPLAFASCPWPWSHLID